MPTYEYHCTKCDSNFEEFQKMSDPPVDRCPDCGGKAERLISPGAGLLFKGSGFYITDYRSESYQKRAKEESGSTKPDTGVKASESKPAKPKKTPDSTS